MEKTFKSLSFVGTLGLRQPAAAFGHAACCDRTTSATLKLDQSPWKQGCFTKSYSRL